MRFVDIPQKTYRTKVKFFIRMLRFATATAKVEATTEAATAKVAAGEDAAGEEDALAPARSEQVVGAHIFLTELLGKVQAH